MGAGSGWGKPRNLWAEKQERQKKNLIILRRNFKRAPMSKVASMLAKHGLKLVKGEGIFEG